MRGEILLHPVALAAAAVYGLNDWWLKAAHPGVLSGKLSDVAGLVVLPVTLFALAELAARRPLSSRVYAALVGVSALGFAAVEVIPAAETAWCATWGTLYWPLRALHAAAVGADWPSWAPVRAWSDWTDLLTLPAAGLAWLARPVSSPRSPCS
ncbi:MAG: hypothetical protein ABMA64_12440 [Myxococcota bacterium]